MPPIFFIAGTDTDVGKTYVASLVIRRLCQLGKSVGVYKPVASGCTDQDGVRIADDAVRLWQAAGCLGTLDEVCPQRFLAPLAPPAAAEREGTSVDAERLSAAARVWRDRCDILIIEGAGGLFSPLADGILNIDLFQRFPAAKMFLVAANRLGAIHQTLSVIEASAGRGIEPAGIILCDAAGNADGSQETNANQISRYTNVPILASVRFGDDETSVDQAARRCLVP